MYGPTGTLTRTDDGNVITFERSFRAAPQQVWEALTTEAGITSWLAPSARIEQRLGGAVAIEFEESQRVTGTITSWDPFTLFAHTWIINDETPSEISYTLAPTDEGTTMTLIHRGLPDEMCGGYTPGWHAFLARLDADLTGAAQPDWEAVFGEVAPLYAAM